MNICQFLAILIYRPKLGLFLAAAENRRDKYTKVPYIKMFDIEPGPCSIIVVKS